MVIGFKQQFVEPILQGTKVHTIRADNKGRWKPGLIMHMATGVRTKNYNCFKKVVCQSIQDFEVKIHYKGKVQRDVTFKIDGVEISHATFSKLYKNDGFNVGVDFFIWFDTDFKGKIIHWTDLIY